MIYSVDRIEGAFAVLIGDEGDDMAVLLADLPDGVKEGAVLRREKGAYTVDTVEEARRRSRILSLQEKLRNKGQN